VRLGAARLATLALLAVTVAACGQAPLPPRLGGLRRSRVWTGERAARMISELHGKRVAPVNSTIAEYGKDGRLRVWLSRYPDPSHAQRAFAAMLARLGSGDAAFTKPRQEPDDPGRWFTVGPGGHHVLWASGASIYWVQADPGLLERALLELPGPSRSLWI